MPFDLDARLRLAGTANSGATALTVVGAVLAGGDSIDDVAVLRAGAAAANCSRGCGRAAPDRPT